MIPWSSGHGWQRGPQHDAKQQTAWVPGTRGAFYAETPLNQLTPFSPPAMKVEPAGKALIANNNDTLAGLPDQPETSPDKTAQLALRVRASPSKWC
jgi:hypothetical protein